ncbi:MAG: amidohydrolase family protein, partial [Hadesarchaea archaeon]|nr:amidohydrolase family protein [Hadesarchaea archaeon]
IRPPSDLAQISRRIWQPMKEEMTQSDAKASAMIACLKFIKNGVTCFASTHASGHKSIGRSLDETSSAIEEAGLRAFIGFEATESTTHAEGARGMKENVRFLEKIEKKRKSRVQGLVSLQSSSNSSDELLRHARRVSKRFGAPITIHAAESQMDPQIDLKEHGKRTVKRLYDLDLLSRNTVLFDCVNVNEDELELIKISEAGVSHNPQGNMLSGVGIAPVPQMLEKRIPVGLGNDGYFFNEFENLRSAYLIHKLNSQDPRTITPYQALKMATIDGARLYGMENELGSIEKGKLADLIIINPDSLPTPLRRENTLRHVINSARGCDVETVITDGRLLMHEKRVITLDEEDVIKKSNKSSKKIWNKLDSIKR